MHNSTIAKLVLTGAVLIAGVAFFAKSGQTNSQHYFKVEKLMATDLSQWKDTELKVHGNVVAGSIKEKVVSQETVRTFLVASEGKRIRVFGKGPKPDTFKDQSEVVATGRVVPASQMAGIASSLGVNIESDMQYVVDATELMAKCPSKYEGAQANKNLDSGSGVKFK